MAVKINVRKDLKGVPKRVKQMTKKGQYALANQVHSDMEDYVPALSRDLRNHSYVTADNKEVVYPEIYAKRQFYNQFSNYTTPGTGPRWDLKAKSIHGKSWERIIKKAMK